MTTLVLAVCVCLALLTSCSSGDPPPFTIRIDTDAAGAQIVRCVEHTARCKKFVATLCATQARQRVRR